MYIQDLKIRNFRSLVNVELKDLRPLILLFGHNGSGKSNILAALDIIFCPKVQPPDVSGGPASRAPFYRGLLTDFQHNYFRNDPSSVSFEVTLRTTKNELKKLWPEGFRNGGEIVPLGTAEDRVRIHLVGHIDPEPDVPTVGRMVLESAKILNTPVYDISSVTEPWLTTKKDSLSLDERSATGEALLDKFTGLFSNIGIARSLRRESFRNLQEQAGVDEDLSSSFKRRVFSLKHSQLQAEQEKFRRTQELFNNIADLGVFDFAQVGTEGKDLELMIWDQDSLWLPVSRRGAGAEQLLVIISEVIIRGSRILGIEELESNLDEKNQMKLYDLLEKLVTDTESNVGQIIATAHSSFYGYEPLPHQKLFVKMGPDGRTSVNPWSSEASSALFKQFSFRHELEARQKEKAKAKRERKK